MNYLEETNLLKTAVENYGAKQIDKCAEKCERLSSAINNFKAYGPTAKNEVCDAVADVEIMINQMRIIFGQDDIDFIKNQKLNRLKEILQ